MGNKAIYIRADGNPEIGTGHIMRCLSIADAMRRRGGAPVFVVADDAMEALLSERGYPTVCLNSFWRDMEQELDALCAVLNGEPAHDSAAAHGGELAHNAAVCGATVRNEAEGGGGPPSKETAPVPSPHRKNKIIVDSYFVTPAYLQTLRQAAHVVYIDDLSAFHYPCDTLINYNAYANKLDYPTRYPDTKLLLGCRYAPLREEFQNLPRRMPRKEAKSVLVTTGGIDPYNVAAKLTRRAKESSDIKHLEFHIVAGRFNAHTNELKQLEREFDGITIHRDVQKMSWLMLDCDVAVSAGGSTLYELCACGTPTVTFALADNQLDGVAALGDGYMINAGDVRENEEKCLSRIVGGLQALVSDHPLRLALSEKMQHLVDGQGAGRIAESLT